MENSNTNGQVSHSAQTHAHAAHAQVITIPIPGSHGHNGNKRQCSNFSAISISQSVMEKTSCDKKSSSKKLRLGKRSLSRSPPENQSQSETLERERDCVDRTRDRGSDSIMSPSLTISVSNSPPHNMNGHSSYNSLHHRSSSTSGPLTKNVGVGANLSITRPINNSYTSTSCLTSNNGPSNAVTPCTSSACGSSVTVTSVTGRNYDMSVAGGNGTGGGIQGSLISNLGGGTATASQQKESQGSPSSRSPLLLLSTPTSTVNTSSNVSGQGQGPQGSGLPSPSSSNAQAQAHFLLAQQQHQQHQHQLAGTASKGGSSAKICSQNLNRTLAVTSVPSNDSELQLFRVLQRANLLNYFDVMIELGGDDVQQLCEAGEEEFLEIMALVGMASKPLHVRRLQKSLQEWMTQPHLFPSPMLGASFHAPAMGQVVQPPFEVKQEPGTCVSASPSHPLPIRPIPYPATATAVSLSTGSGSMHSPNTTPPPPSPGVPSQSPYFNPHQLKNLQFRISLRDPSLIQHSSSTGSDSLINRSNSNSPVTQSTSSTSSSPLYTQTTFQMPPQSPTLFNSSNTLLSGGSLIGSTSMPTMPSSVSSFRPHAHPQSQSHPYQHQGIVVPRHPLEQMNNPSPYLDTRTPVSMSPPTSSTPPQSQSQSQSSTNTAAEVRFDSRSSLSPTPSLQDHEIEKIHESAIKVVQVQPPELNEPKVTKRKACDGYEAYESLKRLSLDDPRRVFEIRKYSPIYGRYNCNRKVKKPLTIHELSVNEAAAQLCFQIPGLLMRRKKLQDLSRQVVREAGLPYSCAITSSIGLVGGKETKTFSAGGGSELHSGSSSSENSSCQHLNNNNNGKRVNLSEDYNRSSSRPGAPNAPSTTTTTELESDTSSQSQHSSCSGSESLVGAAVDYPRSPFEAPPTQSQYGTAATAPTTMANNPTMMMGTMGLGGGGRGYSAQMMLNANANNPRRNSSEPDDLTIPKQPQNQNGGSSPADHHHPHELNLMMNNRARALHGHDHSHGRFKTEPR